MGGRILMNKRQRVVLWIGLGLLFATCLVPPWACGGGVSGGISAGHSTEYGFLFIPPGSARSISFSALFVEWAAVVILTGGALFMLRDKRHE